jgi:hypothetical protein
VKNKMLLLIIAVLIFGSCSRVEQEGYEPVIAEETEIFTAENVEEIEPEEADNPAEVFECELPVYEANDSSQGFHYKYHFEFWHYEFWNNLVGENETAVGGVDTMMWDCFEDEEDYLRPNIWGRNSDLGYFPITEEPDGRLVVRRGAVREITHDLWENWGLQAFEWGGDVTFIGREGALSQIPEHYGDALYFNLSIFGEFEMQYIMYHERENAALWQLLMLDNPYAPDTSMLFVPCWQEGAVGRCVCGVPRSQ